MDELKRRIINRLQGGFPVCSNPFEVVAQQFEIEESRLISEISALKKMGLITRFGPLYNAECMGGVLSLVAMKVPPEKLEHVAELVNRHPEVAHNYAREHLFNLWFVVATDNPSRKSEVLNVISQETGLPVFDMPKEEEYFVGLHLEV